MSSGHINTGYEVEMKAQKEKRQKTRYREELDTLKGRSMGISEAIVGNLQPIHEAPLYILKLPKGITAEAIDDIRRTFKDSKLNLNATVMMMPDTYDLVGTSTFDFSIALKLLQHNNSITRLSMLGYLYMEYGSIYKYSEHEDPDPNWIPTQEDILARDWIIK